MKQVELDRQFMQQALEQAGLAALAGEVPVGAVIVRNGEVVARAFNQPITKHDPSAHAEMLVLRQAALSEENYRLPGTTLYVLDVFSSKQINHQTVVEGGVMAQECGQLLRDFFKERR